MRLGGLDWVILVGVVVVAWLLGRTRRDPNTWRGFFIAGASLGATGTAATYVGANLTFTAIFLILSEETYKRGLVVLCIPVFWVLGTFLFLRVYPHLTAALKSGLTLHGYLGERYQSSAVQRVASIWTLAAFVGTVALEFYGGIRLLQWAAVPLFANLSLALFFAFLTTAFTVSGGFRGVARADVWMDTVLLAATGVLAYELVFRPLHLPAAAVPNVPAPGFDIAFLIGMGVIFLPFQLCLLDSWQRCSAWEKLGYSPRRWLLPGALILGLAYCVPIFIGEQVRNAGILLSGGVHPLGAYLNRIGLPTGLLGLIFAGFFCAVLSTADELLNCCSMTVVFDILRVPVTKVDRTQLEEARIVTSGKFYTIVFAVLSAIAAVLCLFAERGIADLAIALFSAQVAFTLPLVVGIVAPSRAQKWGVPAVAAVLGALVATLSLVSMGWMRGDQTLVDAAPLASLVAACVFFALTAVVCRLHGDGRA